MLTRIIVSVIMAVVLVPFIFLSDTIALPILISVLCAIGVFEMIRCLGLHKNMFILIPSMLVGACGPVCARLISNGSFSNWALSISALFVLYMLCYFTFSDDKITLEQAFGASAETLYISFGFTFLILSCDSHSDGLYIMLSVFIISWMTDIFAYFTGRFFGKHKLIPKISPKKTVEGSIGGILFSVLSMTAYAFILSKATDLSPKYLMFIAAGLFGSLVSQAGDLLMSAVKRKKEIKDYGKLFPGHGGVLDRFDSVLAVSVVVYIIAHSIGFFNFAIV